MVSCSASGFEATLFVFVDSEENLCLEKTSGQILKIIHQAAASQTKPSQLVAATFQFANKSKGTRNSPI